VFELYGVEKERAWKAVVVVVVYMRVDTEWEGG
jgi:hypothetical protein